MAYPTSIISFTTHNAGDIIDPADVNSPDTEIVSIETDLISGMRLSLKPLTNTTYDLGTVALAWRNLYLSGGAGGSLEIAPANPAANRIITLADPGANDTLAYLGAAQTFSGKLTFTGDMLFKSGRPWIDIQAYGAKGDGTTDDTSSINSAVSGARTSKFALFCPAGTYLVSSINATALQGVRIYGEGPSVTVFKPSTTQAYPVFDFTASSLCSLENVGIGQGGAQTVVPGAAVLLSNTTGGASTANRLYNVDVDGKWATAGLLMYATGDNTVIASRFSNRQNVGANTAGVAITNTNTTFPTGIASNYQTLTTGNQTTSDNTFIQAETHDQAVTTGASVINGLFLQGVVTTRWYGGVIASSHYGVKLVGATNLLTISGAVFYADNGTQPTYHIYNSDATTKASHVYENNSYTNAGTAIIGTANNGFWTGLRVLGAASGSASTPSTGMLFFEGAHPADTISVNTSFIDCDTMSVNMTGGGSIKNSILLNPGTITLGSGSTYVPQFAPTVTLKKGSGLGDYYTTSTTYVDMDATNLAVTTTVLVGQKATITADCGVYQSTGPSGIHVAITDGATVLEEKEIDDTAFNTVASWSRSHVFTGDGASHTFKLQFKTNAAADAANVHNGSQGVPVLTVRIEYAQ